MTEDQNKIAATERIDDQDWFLQNLIEMVNGSDLTFGVTLNHGLWPCDPKSFERSGVYRLAAGI